MLQAILDYLMPQTCQPLTFEIPSEIPEVKVEEWRLEMIKDAIKPWMREHFRELEERERLILKNHTALTEYILIWDNLLRWPAWNSKSLKNCEKFDISEAEKEAETREAIRTAGIYLVLWYEIQAVRIIYPASEYTDTYDTYLPNSLMFQWMDEIRHEDQGIPAESLEEGKSLTALSNRPVWMRAVKRWLDIRNDALFWISCRDERKGELPPPAPESICDYCAGPCGDCSERWSDNPHSCDSCARAPECISCPLHPYQLTCDTVGPGGLYDAPYDDPDYDEPGFDYPNGSWEDFICYIDPDDVIDDEYFRYLSDAINEDDDAPPPPAVPPTPTFPEIS